MDFDIGRPTHKCMQLQENVVNQKKLWLNNQLKYIYKPKLHQHINDSQHNQFLFTDLDIIKFIYIQITKFITHILKLTHTHKTSKNDNLHIWICYWREVILCININFNHDSLNMYSSNFWCHVYKQNYVCGYFYLQQYFPIHVS